VHEWALAEGVLATARDVARRENLATVTRIEVRIGELQHIKKDVFAFALKEVADRVPGNIGSPRIELEIEPASFRCRACAREFALAEGSDGLEPDEVESIHFVPELAHVHLRCPQCESPDFEVVRGRGVRIHAIEGD
jgi:hydrogenase nickel incorporation protein HypA/HybF